MLSLDDLALKYGSDKASIGHNYTPLYQDLFTPIKDTATNILEIGVQHGASMKMWKDWFPNAKIHGIDNGESLTYTAEDEPRIRLYDIDQGDFEELEKFTKDQTNFFDLIIDDGSHIALHQTTSLVTLWPTLKYGGFYIVEDTHTDYCYSYSRSGRLMDFLHRRVDDINYNGKDFGLGHEGNPVANWKAIAEPNIFEASLHSITFLKSLAVLVKASISPDGYVRHIANVEK